MSEERVTGMPIPGTSALVRVQVEGKIERVLVNGELVFDAYDADVGERIRIEHLLDLPGALWEPCETCDEHGVLVCQCLGR
jgi:hypothetical protein